MIHQTFIGATSIPLTAVSFNTATYNGSAQTASVSSVTPTGATYSSPTPQQTNAGSYSTSITGNGAYRGTVSNTWTINPKTVTFSYSPTSFTYNGGAQGPTVTPSDGSATYTNGGTTSATNVGSYTITSTANGNFTGSGSSGWSISAKSVTFSYSPTSFTYNGGYQGPTVTPSDGSATYSNSGNTSEINAGSYTIYSTANGNYTGSGSSAWSIAKANQSTVSISGPSTGTPGNSYNFTASGGSDGNYQFGGSGSGTTNPNSVYFGSSGTFSVTVYREATTNYNQSNTASTDITISSPCFYYEIKYDFNSEIDMTYTDCAGNPGQSIVDYSHSGDPGYIGASFTTVCARENTFSIVAGTATKGAGC